MNEVEKINNTELAVKVYQGQRVVTFKDIDMVHEKPEGTAKRNFNTNKKHFIEGEDFFTVCADEIRTHKIMELSNKAREDVTFFTEQGYLMLVKSFTDDLAWSVQRQLVKSYFRKKHDVEKLTITSREVAKIVGKLHPWVLQGIRERMDDLESLGFSVNEFYTETVYHGGNNQDRPQFLLTERGCEDFSRCLEPEARQTFINEFTDRFERMQAVIEGKPVKKPPKLISMAEVQEKEPLIRLYRNNNWGVLLMNDELYNLTPEEIEVIESFIPELQRYSIGKIQYVIKAYLTSQKRNNKLEEIASWGIDDEEKPQVPLLPDKATQKPKSDKDYNAPFITAKQAENRYNMCHGNIVKLAKESGA